MAGTERRYMLTNLRRFGAAGVPCCERASATGDSPRRPRRPRSTASSRRAVARSAWPSGQRRLSSAPLFDLLAENNVRQGFLEPSAFEAVVSKLPSDVERAAERITLRAEHSNNGEPRILPARARGADQAGDGRAESTRQRTARGEGGSGFLGPLCR